MINDWDNNYIVIIIINEYLHFDYYFTVHFIGYYLIINHFLIRYFPKDLTADPSSLKTQIYTPFSLN